MKLSRLLSIVKLGFDVLLSEHLQSRCIDSSMYRYTPIAYLVRWALFTGMFEGAILKLLFIYVQEYLYLKSLQ